MPLRAAGSGGNKGKAERESSMRILIVDEADCSEGCRRTPKKAADRAVPQALGANYSRGINSVLKLAKKPSSFRTIISGRRNA
jgi:hypothetical protein